MGYKTAQPSKLMTDFIGQCGGYAVIDGGLATELERHGANLNDPLWSAKCLVTSPQLIRRVHLDYLEAGANIIISSSYQATLQGFEAKGLSRVEGEALLRKSVEIACEAREIYYSRDAKVSSDVIENRENLKQHPVLVGASVGSYGAYLADGSEYSGIYGDAVTLETLKDFHRRRVQVLAESGADLIAFETIPNKLEAKAYAELLQEEDIKIPAWFSFNSKDGTNVVSGDSISECASIADSCKQVVAVGINCTPPRFIHGLIQAIREVTAKPILIYPNSGETYDADRKVWVQSTGVADEDFVSYVGKWCEAGASLIGGCCRTTPNTIFLGSPPGIRPLGPTNPDSGSSFGWLDSNPLPIGDAGNRTVVLPTKSSSNRHLTTNQLVLPLILSELYLKLSPADLLLPLWSSRTDFVTEIGTNMYSF